MITMMRFGAQGIFLLALMLALAGCGSRVSRLMPVAPSVTGLASSANQDLSPPVQTPAVASEANPTTVLATGTPVAYRVCSRTEHWQRPDMAAMQRIFTDPRFGDGRRPDPVNYALYLSQFFYIAYPTANSANKENVTFSGEWSALNDDTATITSCDYQALYDGMAREGKAFQSLWLVDHHVVAMRHQGRQLVIQVEDAPQTFEEVVFPYPPATTVATVVGPAGFRYSLVQVLNPAGAEIYEERLPEARNGYETWQADNAGRLMYAVVWGQPDSGAFSLLTGSGPALARFDVFAGGREMGPGKLVLTREGGGAVVQSLSATGSAWDLLSTLDLQPGRYRLQTEQLSLVLLRREVPPP